MTKTVNARLNNIIGQIEGIKRMVAKKSDCLQILTQLKAVRSAVGSVMDSIIEDQFNTCMKSIKKEDKEMLINIKNYVKTN